MFAYIYVFPAWMKNVRCNITTDIEQLLAGSRSKPLNFKLCESVSRYHGPVMTHGLVDSVETTQTGADWRLHNL